MKNIGIIKRIDTLGRITIPIEIRRITGLTNVLVDLSIESGVIVLRKGSGRPIDTLGRYLIPIDIRRINGWVKGQELTIYAEGNAICIKKPGCEWCSETENLAEIVDGEDTHLLCWKHAGMVADRLLKI